MSYKIMMKLNDFVLHTFENLMLGFYYLPQINTDVKLKINFLNNYKNIGIE